VISITAIGDCEVMEASLARDPNGVKPSRAYCVAHGCGILALDKN
jgi:hypothetical protein